MKAFLFLIIIVVGAQLFAAKAKITSFKKTINTCFPGDFSGDKVETLDALYAAIEKNFILASANLEERETLFTDGDLNKKLKFEKDRWTVSKISDDGTITPIDSGLRQKKPSIELTLSEILLYKKIQSDWTKSKEVRAGQRIVLISRADGEIKALQLQKWQQKKRLECLRVDKSDICSCRPVK